MSKRAKFLLGIGVIATLVIGWQVAAFATLPGSDFQGNDGNLIDDGAGFDWNSFDTPNIVWTGTAPNRLADVENAGGTGWHFVGKEDGQKRQDNGFAGGTKQDDNCPSVISTGSPNKDDLKRAYLATKVIGGDIFLNLAWERIKQNNTSASAHVGFEFNQGDPATESCGSSGLVERQEGDLLIVYDFEGSAQDPVLSYRTWVTDPSDTCEVGSNDPPCWSPKTDLGAFSEAKVNGPLTGIGPVLDTVAPSNETLGVSEFGEASINLSDALPDVFGPGTCPEFGKAEVISRSSGNSEQAAMMDLVGPVDFDLSPCVTNISSTQSFIPQDQATITGQPTTGFNGTVDFKLYSGRNCAGGTPAGTLLYEDLANTLVDPVTGLPSSNSGAIAKTNNDGTADPNTKNGYTITGTGGDFSWLVTYNAADGEGHPDQTTCVEESRVTIDNDDTVAPNPLQAVTT